MMQIFVTTETGKSITLNVGEQFTIENVKWMLYGKKGMPVREQRLNFGTSEDMEDGRTLLSYNIQNLSTLYLMMFLDGGAVKRGRATMDKADKIDEIRADINLKLLQLAGCQHPEVVLALGHIEILMAEMALFPDTALASAMKRMPTQLLHKMHDSLGSTNSDWKVSILAKQIFIGDLGAVAKTTGEYKLLEGMI